MQQEDQEQVFVPSKDLVFKQYPSIQQSKNSKLISIIKQCGHTDQSILWVASETIHGSNFSIHYNGQTVRYGRRNDFLTKDIPVPCENPGQFFNQSFYDARNLVKKFHNNLNQVFESIKKFDQNMIRFSIYGQYFGGLWPTKIQGKNSPQAVQRQVTYCPQHQFFAFDIYIVTNATHYWVDALDVQKLLGKNIVTVPLYAKGTFEEMFALNSVIDSTIPQFLGLQKLQKNIIQGFVIRPNKNISLKNGKRVIIKKKNQQFMQKTKQPKPGKKQKKQVNLEPQQQILADQLSKYINFNRIQSAISKFPDLKDRNKLKQIILKDILSDAEKDEIKLPQQNEFKKVLDYINKLLMKEINSYYVKH